MTAFSPPPPPSFPRPHPTPLPFCGPRLRHPIPQDACRRTSRHGPNLSPRPRPRQTTGTQKRTRMDATARAGREAKRGVSWQSGWRRALLVLPVSSCDHVRNQDEDGGIPSPSSSPAGMNHNTRTPNTSVGTHTDEPRPCYRPDDKAPKVTETPKMYK